MLFAGFAFALSGCAKKWKEPGEVAIVFQTNGFENGTADSHGEFDFHDGFFKVTEIQLVGSRVQAEDVAFTQTINEDFIFNQADGAYLAYFQLPQGTYSELNVELTLGNSNNDQSIQLDGIYVGPTNQEDTLQLSSSLQSVIRIQADENDGTPEVVIVAETSRRLNITLDFNYWFGNVTPNMMDNADHVGGDPNAPINISPTENPTIYDAIVERIPDGITARFE